MSVGSGAPVLSLALVGERLRVGLAGEVFERRIDRKAIDTLTGELDLVMNRATRWGDEDQGSAAMGRRSCELLFDSLWPGPVKAFLRSHAGPLAIAVVGQRGEDLAAETSSETGAARAWLEALPFELMHDGQGLLGERLGLARVGAEPAGALGARGAELGAEPAGALGERLGLARVGAEPAGALGTRGAELGAERAGALGARGAELGAGRALVICDPRGDLIGAYHEGLAVRDELVGLGFDVDLRSTEVTALDVLRLLRDYELVHFAGHGERPATERGGAARGWWLKDEVLSAAMLAELAGGRPMPALVFSNACRSLVGAEGDGLAAAMMRGGTRHVLGTTREVPDEVAALFALSFYERLATGACVGEAVRAARVQLRERYGSGTIYGGAWVLFGEPEAVVRAGERRDEPVVSTPILEPGLRLRGSAVGVAALGAGEVGGPIGATRGQALLAAFGALALLVLVVVLVAGALSGGAEGRGRGAEVVPVGPRLEDPILRAHPVEHWPVQPLWGPAVEP